MEIFDSIILLDGTKVDAVIARGRHYSRVNKKFSNQNEYDIVPFLMEELCLVNGNKRQIDFFLELSADDYYKIMEMLSSLITPIR